MKAFIGFILVSGVGWILDFVSYTILVQAANFSPAYGNFLSSMIGVTYVWLVALNRVFAKGEFGKSVYLPLYWGYQAISISGYSALISLIVNGNFNFLPLDVLMFPLDVAAKILVTPVNLLTNFTFMTILAKFMKSDSQGKVL